jgi:hypothetical protein
VVFANPPHSTSNNPAAIKIRTTRMRQWYSFHYES